MEVRKSGQGEGLLSQDQRTQKQVGPGLLSQERGPYQIQEISKRGGKGMSDLILKNFLSMVGIK